MEYTAEKGCRSAHSDAHHDFKAGYRNDLVNEYIPQNPKYNNCSMTEDQFFKEYILQSNDSTMLINAILSPDKNPKEITDIKDKFQSSISDKYEVHAVKRSSVDEQYKRYHPPNQSTHNKSFIEDILKNLNLTDEIYFIGDTSDPNIMDDLASVQNTNFYWVQNAQTLYDPAGKTAYHTDAGRDYGFQNPNSKFTFCWERYDSGYTLYPHWNESANQAVDSEAINENNKEIMFYTNRDIYMAIEKKDDKNNNTDDYTNHDSGILITYPKKKGMYAYANSSLAEIKSSLVNDDNYYARAEIFKDLIANLIKNKESAAWNNVQEKNMTNKYLAKRLGDSGQSLSCLRNKIKLQRFEKKDKKDKIINFSSNNLLAFISFDKLAIAFSILYGSPIIIQSIREEQDGVANKSSGFIVYVRKDLLDPVKSIRSNYTANVLAQNIQKFKNIDNNVIQLQNVEESVVRFTGFLQQIVINKKDTEYSSLIAVYMKYLNVFHLLKIIQFKKIDYDQQTIKEKLLKILNFSVNNLNQIRGIKINEITKEDIDKCFSSDVNFIQNTMLSKINSDIDKTLGKYAKEINSIINYLNGSLNSLFELYRKQTDIMTTINEILQTIPEKYTTNTIKELKITKVDYTPYNNLCYGRYSDRGGLDDKVERLFGVNQIISIFHSFDYNSYGKNACSHFVKQINICIEDIQKCATTKGKPAEFLVNMFKGQLNKIGFFTIPETKEPDRDEVEKEIADSYLGSPMFISISNKNRERNDILDLGEDEGEDVESTPVAESNPNDVPVSKSAVPVSKSDVPVSNPPAAEGTRYNLRSVGKKGGAGTQNLTDFIAKISKLTVQDLGMIQTSIDKHKIDMNFPTFGTMDDFYRSLYEFEVFLHGFMRILVMIKTDEVAITSNKLENTLPYFTFPSSQMIMTNIFNYLYSNDKPPIDEPALKQYVKDFTENEISICYSNVAEKLFSSNKFLIQKRGQDININEAIYQYINYTDERLSPEKKKQLVSIFGSQTREPGPHTFPFPEEMQSILNILTNANELKYIKAVLNGILSYNITTFHNLKELVEGRPKSQSKGVILKTGFNTAKDMTMNAPKNLAKGIYTAVGTFGQGVGTVLQNMGGKKIPKKSKKNKKVNRKTRKKRV